MGSDLFDEYGIVKEESELTILIKKLGLTKHDNLIFFGNISKKIFLFSFNDVENIKTLLENLSNRKINWENKKYGVIISLTGEEHSINEKKDFIVEKFSDNDKHIFTNREFTKIINKL